MTEASKHALESVDALLASDPSQLNEQTRRLRRFMWQRRIAYYSVLLPFGLLSRMSALLVLVSAVAATVAAAVVLVMGGGLPLFLFLAYWGIGGLLYHVFSVRMVALTEDAATSLEMSGKAVLAKWGGWPVANDG